jgi:predicted nucleotidyltransferase component of viral defense system
MDTDRKLRLNSSQTQHIFVMRAVAERLQDTPYILKGGTALILTRSLDRYSTDLDFDSEQKINLTGRIETALKNIREIELRSLKLVKDTDTVQRYKIHYVDQLTGEDTLLKIETSFRQSPPPQSIETIAGIKTYKIEYLFDQKLNAAQNRTVSRDLYDLAFLVEQFGTQLRDEQIEAVQQFVANPDQLVEQYRLTFQLDEALSNLTTVEDIVLSLHFGVENLQSQRANDAKEITQVIQMMLEKYGQAKEDGSIEYEGNTLRFLGTESEISVQDIKSGTTTFHVKDGKVLKHNPNSDLRARMSAIKKTIQETAQQEQNIGKRKSIRRGR